MFGPASSETKSRSGARRLALITGASSGIGAAFARAYAERGLDVVLVARRIERLEALAAELAAAHGIEAHAIPADLARFEAHVPVLEAVAARGRTVDVLVNNAGFGIPKSFTGVVWERQRDFLMTLVVSACGFAYGVIPGMVERGSGAIINVASIAGFSPGVAGNTLYPGAKSLAIKFSQALDAEYRARGLRISALCPGATESEFLQTAGLAELTARAPRMAAQSASAVVEIAIAANERGRVVIIPGWRNRLAVGLMRALPEAVTRPIINGVAAKYRPRE